MGCVTLPSETVFSLSNRKQGYLPPPLGSGGRIRKDTCQTSVGLLDAGKEVARSRVTYSQEGGEENSQRRGEEGLREGRGMAGILTS